MRFVLTAAVSLLKDEEVKTVLSEAIQQHGYMSIEEAEQITLAIIEKEYTLP